MSERCLGCLANCIINKENPWKSIISANCPNPKFIPTAVTEPVIQPGNSPIVNSTVDFGLQTFGGTDSARRHSRNRI